MTTGIILIAGITLWRYVYRQGQFFSVKRLHVTTTCVGGITIILVVSGDCLSFDGFSRGLRKPKNYLLSNGNFTLKMKNYIAMSLKTLRKCSTVT